MKKLIINADDFGYSRSVNYGIIDAHTEGVLSSTTLMTNMPGTEHAFELGKKHPNLGIGVHLTLTCGSPLLKNHRTLVDSDGNFKKLYHYQDKFWIDEDELYKEWKAQIEKFLDSGLVPTHLDSHHHINNLKSIIPVFTRLAEEYHLPVRNNFEVNKYSDHLITTDLFEYNPEVLLLGLIALNKHFGSAKTIEIMCHPAYLDKFIMSNSSYATPRIEELATLIHPNTREKIEESGDYQLITYEDLTKGVNEK